MRGGVPYKGGVKHAVALSHDEGGIMRCEGGGASIQLDAML